jgi:hypothetical protein
MSLLPVSVGFLDSTHPKVLTTLGILTSLQTVRVVDSTLGEDRDLYGNAEFDIPNDTISATVLTGAPRIGSETELSK